MESVKIVKIGVGDKWELKIAGKPGGNRGQTTFLRRDDVKILRIW